MIHLDNAFAQYQDKPGDLDDILTRWCGSLIAGLDRAPTVDLEAVVPVVNGRRWIEQQRDYHQSQFGDDPPFSLCWEPYNSALVVVYAEFHEGLRFIPDRGS
jgi:hypothetical protein